MTYAQYGLIQATDFNTLVGTNPNTTSGTLNTVWATGGTSAGYGQTAVGQVTAGGTVTAAGQWNALVSNTANAATHQGTSISAVTAPVTGNTITYVSAISTNLTTIYNSRLNAASQGTTTSNTATFGSTWASALTFTFTATFANGDAARYFFNSGGQLALTCSHPTGTGINLLLNNLASNVGTVVLSAPTSGTITVSSTSYSGVTKIGGGGNAPSPYLTNNGYYALTTANANVFQQAASTGPSGYLSTNIKFLIKSNGTQGTNGDAGSIITIYCLWTEIPTGLTASSGSATTLTLRPPETTYLANSWGAVTLSGTVSGS
jgi:hypothetical protein